MSETEPKIFTRDELKDLFREVLLEHHELVSLPAENSDDRQRLKEDAIFLRRLRLSIDGAATKVGYAVLVSIVGAVIAVFVTGWKIRFPT